MGKSLGSTGSVPCLKPGELLAVNADNTELHGTNGPTESKAASYIPTLPNCSESTGTVHVVKDCLHT